MPVTIILRNEPEPCSNIGRHKVSGVDFLQKTCPIHSPPATAGVDALEGTWKDPSEEDIIMASSDSFVRDALEAYARHLHLVVRPDEVWFTILTQLSFYMTANIETVKDPFVPYGAQKELVVIESLEMRHLLDKFHDAIQDRFKAPWLGQWVMPDFSTTKPGDCITASCLMMETMQQTSSTNSVSGNMCGIPCITLLGEVDDWQKLVHKLDRLELEYLGQEPADYAASLRTVLDQFVYSFDDADRADINEFWNAMIRGYRSDARGGSAVRIDGWLLEFLKWDKSGNPIEVFESRLGSMTDSDEYCKMSPSFAMHSLPNAVGYVTTPFRCANNTRQDAHPYGDDIRGSSTFTHGSSTWQSSSVQGTDDGKSRSLKRLIDRFKRR